jgi:type II secretory pathway component PulF
MATYVFKAMDLAGVQAKGEVEADSKQAVAEQLKERGLVVVDIAHKYRSKEINIELFSRVNAKDLAVASRHLATMVTSGMSITRALHVLETQTGSKLLRETIAAVGHDVEAGLLLSDAMARHPKVFGPLYVAMVHAGETGGVLEECLLRVADQLENNCCAAPPGARSDDLPGRGHHVRDHGSDGVGGVPDPGVRRCVQAVPGQAPGADTVHGEFQPPGDTPVNAVIEKSMGDVITSVKGGGTISAPLRQCSAFPAMVSQMVGVGEETGALDTMLAKIADFYDSEVEAAVKALTSIMEPVMIIFVGGIVGVIVISMYLPLFSIYNSIK